ncbi:MAG: thioredoxin domain-containing protein [Planctomycetota bacterium]
MCNVDLPDAGLPPLGPDERLSGRGAIQDYLGRLSAAEEARRASKPLMAYFYVRTSQAAGRKVKPTRQTNACRMVERLFDGSDTGIGTAAKFFVTCDIDVSRVDPRQNPVFNSRTAPAIALLDSKGNLVSLLSGKITSSSLLRGMMLTLAKSGISSAKVTIGKKILSQIAKLENERSSASLRRSSAEGGLAEAKKKRQRSRIASQQNVLRKAEEVLKQATKALAEQKKLWEDLFKT